MDPHFVVTREEFHHVQSDLKQMQYVQSGHADRLLRLEKRQADDAALKSVWTSPFPGVLSGTPQQDPLPNDFDDLDDRGQNLLGSLHLEADDEPIRRGAASRANSVRFDESALQSGWASGRAEFAPTRPSSGLGSHAMTERSLSHKSDGRHSSAGHSVHSMHSGLSGRASSLGLDTNFAVGSGSARGGRDDSDLSLAIPEPPPGLFILGSVPSLIRCWLSLDFSSATLLYAAVCTGAQTSSVDLSLVKELGLEGDVRRDGDGLLRIRLSVYLAEARVVQSNSRSASPAPQLPSIHASFDVTESVADTPKRIRVFLGSDTLRTHSADILFSQNLMTLYGTDRDKLSVPFVRPEDDATFKHLATTHVLPERPRLNATAPEFVSSEREARSSYDADSQGILSPTEGEGDASKAAVSATPSESGPENERPGAEAKESSRRESGAAIWGPWRQGSVASDNGPLSGYQPPSSSSSGRTGRGMKVLKAKSGESRQKPAETATRDPKRTFSGTLSGGTKSADSGSVKAARSANNPLGNASAFASWMSQKAE